MAKSPLLFYNPAAGPAGGVTPAQTTGPTGYTPQQIRGAYGVNLIKFGSTPGDGTGETIAIIDPGNNPGFQPTGPNYAGSMLQLFDKKFGLPDPPSFGIFNEQGATTPLPGEVNSGWGTEIALDVEWAHSMAPGANIDLVEATAANFLDIMQTVETAITTLGADVVSMSILGEFEASGNGADEQFLDDTYLVPALAFNPDVTILAATGDSGANPGDAPNYPSVSPLVVAVGGTTLQISKTNQWQSETGWSYGSDSFAPSSASGGGISNFYTEPTYQDGVQSSGFREVPDISADADPNTGVPVFDPNDFGNATPWVQVGGTSLSTPMWAGFMSIADQGRALAGYPKLAGSTQVLPALYSIAQSPSYSTYLHDITVGFNAFQAGKGYDLVTGLGTPILNNLVPGFVNYGQATKAVIAVEPPTSVIQGGVFGTLVEAETASGAFAFGFTGTATISLLNGPGGETFTSPQPSFTYNFDNGTAVIDGLTLPGAPAPLPTSSRSR